MSSQSRVFQSCVRLYFFFFRVAGAADYGGLLTFLYIFQDYISILHGIASSSCQLRLEGGMGEEEPSTLLSYCLYHVDIIVVEYSHLCTFTRSSRTVAVFSFFIFLCTITLTEMSFLFFLYFIQHFPLQPPILSNELLILSLRVRH